MTSLFQAGEAETLLRAEINGELPDERGRFGPFGGRYIPETLVPAFERLEAGVKEHLHEPGFQAEFQRELREWVGRPTALTHAPRLSERWGADVWLKREDLAHTGAHKINNAIGQALLAKRLGVERVIAETGAGQHGVASAAACARVGLPCAVYMGAIDIERQAPNVDRMRRLGAEVVAVESGDKTLRAAIDEHLPPRWSRNNPVDCAGGETRDTIPTVMRLIAEHESVDAVVYYQATDPVKLAYNVASFIIAATKLAQTNLRNVVGDMDLDEALTSREKINTELRVILDEATDVWGTRGVRVEIQRIDPPADVTDAMHRQMKAERDRRAQVTEAEGEKMSACIVGEPTCPETIGAMIKIGRRGSMSAWFTVKGKQGHSAYLHKVLNPMPAASSSPAGLCPRSGKVWHPRLWGRCCKPVALRSGCASSTPI